MCFHLICSVVLNAYMSCVTISTYLIQVFLHRS